MSNSLHIKTSITGKILAEIDNKSDQIRKQTESDVMLQAISHVELKCPVYTKFIRYKILTRAEDHRWYF